MNLTGKNCKNWQQHCVRSDTNISAGSYRCRVRPAVLMIDCMLSIAVCSCFRPVVMITDTASLFPPSFIPLLHFAMKLDPVLKAKHFRMEFFWSPNCLCDYRQIDTLWCPQPAHPAGTGNDAIHGALTLTGPREATASLTRKMLSISAAGWLCPVIVMLARLWHFCYVDGKCLSPHLLAAQFEFSSTLMDGSWRIIIKKMKSSLTPKFLCCCHSLTHPTVPVTKAVDGCSASSSGLLPFSCCVATQRLNLLTFLIVVERPGDRPCPFSDRTDPLPSPLPRICGLYPCQRTAALWGHMFFLWLSLRPLNPSTCIDPPPISHPSSSLSSPTVSLLGTI